jgi:hypothetical protein
MILGNPSVGASTALGTLSPRRRRFLMISTNDDIVSSPSTMYSCVVLALNTQSGREENGAWSLARHLRLHKRNRSTDLIKTVLKYEDILSAWTSWSKG